jgi:uncharacterized protein (TIGR02284 family)
METIKESVKANLQDVVKNNRQSIEVYNRAAEMVNNAPMSMLFDRLRQQRLYFENILERILEEQGSEVEEDFNLNILARKIWMDIRNLMVYRNEYDILAEVIKAETKLKKSVEKLLEEGTLDENEEKIIRTQSKIIGTDLRKIEKMEAEYSEKLGIDY